MRSADVVRAFRLVETHHALIARDVEKAAARPRVPDADILAQIPAARRRARAGQPVAAEACFDRAGRCLRIGLTNGTVLSVPIDLVPPLRHATDREVADVTVGVAGVSLRGRAGSPGGALALGRGLLRGLRRGGRAPPPAKAPAPTAHSAGEAESLGEPPLGGRTDEGVSIDRRAPNGAVLRPSGHGPGAGATRAGGGKETLRRETLDPAEIGGGANEIRRRRRNAARRMVVSPRGRAPTGGSVGWSRGVARRGGRRVDERRGSCADCSWPTPRLGEIAARAAVAALAPSGAGAIWGPVGSGIDSRGQGAGADRGARLRDAHRKWPSAHRQAGVVAAFRRSALDEDLGLSALAHRPSVGGAPPACLRRGRWIAARTTAKAKASRANGALGGAPPEDRWCGVRWRAVRGPRAALPNHQRHLPPLPHIQSHDALYVHLVGREPPDGSATNGEWAERRREAHRPEVLPLLAEDFPYR